MAEEEICRLRKLYCEEKQQAYDALVELAEVSDFELDPAEDECELAEYMLEKTMRYGTYADSAKAIRHFVKFMHSTGELRHLV